MRFVSHAINDPETVRPVVPDSDDSVISTCRISFVCLVGDDVSLETRDDPSIMSSCKKASRIRASIGSECWLSHWFESPLIDYHILERYRMLDRGNCMRKYFAKGRMIKGNVCAIHMPDAQ